MVALAVVIVVLVIGSLIFHFASGSLGWYFTPLASNWGTIDFTVDITFWVCGIVFVVVNLFTAYCVWKFRARPGNKAHYEPESAKLEIILTAFTTVGVAAMLTPGLFVRLRLPGTVSYQGVMVEDRAVGTDLDRRFVLVVGADKKIESRTVTLGPIVDGLRVVRKGLAAGELVVINGLQRVRPGVTVNPTTATMGGAQ